MVTEFTKGAWIISPNRKSVPLVSDTYIETRHKPIGLVFSCDKEAQANAKLIAAAPELFEALEHCIAALELFSSNAAKYSITRGIGEATIPFIKRAKEAIKKATE